MNGPWTAIGRIGHYRKSHIAWAALAACTVVLAFIADFSGVPNRLSWRASNFDSSANDPVLAAPRTHITSTKLPRDLAISFAVKPTGDHYPNIFQTSDGKSGIRMELTHPNKLNLVLSETRYLLIDNEFSLNRWHRIHLVVRAGEFAEVQIDGKEPIRFDEDVFSKRLYELNRIVVGSGYAHSRNFQGEIRDFVLDAGYQGRYSALDVVVGILIISLLLLYIVNTPLMRSDSSLSTRRFVGEGAMVFMVIVALLAAGRFIGQHELVLGKWYQLLAISLVAGLFPVVTRFGREARLRLVVVIVSIGTIMSVIWKVASLHPSLPPLSSFSLLLLLAAVAVFVYSVPASWGKSVGLLRGLRLADVVPLARMIFLSALFFLTLVALFETPNWTALVYSLISRPATTALLGMFALAFILHYVNVTGGRFCAGGKAETRPWWRTVLAALPYLAFLILAFRTDSLFIPGSEFHWEYFVGPLRTVKAGGSLLWDTPSQYGYLNILLATAIPATTSWQAFYLFQGSLLFAVAVFSYRSITHLAVAGKWFAFVLVVSGVFFADPEHIGPYPFPSSSAVRFFWCYALIYLGMHCLRENQWDMRRWVVVGGGMWVLALFWSAESALYSTAIFFAPLAISALYRPRDLQLRGRNFAALRIAGNMLVVPAVWVGTVIAGVSIWTWARTSHLPDWRMFAEHGFSYASGFGAMPISYWGSGWVLALSFFALCLVLYRYLGNAKAPMVALLAACIWAVSSYYVGRAVPNNVTALLPLISLVLAIALKLGDASTAQFVRAISIPVFAVVLMTGVFSPNFVDTMRSFSAGSSGVERRLRPPDAELAELQRAAEIHVDSPVVYYGFAAAMPRHALSQASFENNWLPTPLQLLEEPISAQRRETIVRRYIQRKRQAGYFIQAKGEHEERAREWQRIIGQSHDAVREYESKNYKIIYYRPKTYDQ